MAGGAECGSVANWRDGMLRVCFECRNRCRIKRTRSASVGMPVLSPLRQKMATGGAAKNVIDIGSPLGTRPRTAAKSRRIVAGLPDSVKHVMWYMAFYIKFGNTHAGTRLRCLSKVTT